MAYRNKLQDPLHVAAARRSALNLLIEVHGVKDQALLNELWPVLTLTLALEAAHLDPLLSV